MKHPLVDTIVIVMMENRSFDHVLGHLSLAPYANGTEVDGLHAPTQDDRYGNPYSGQVYYPFAMRDGQLPSDLPHEWDRIAQQLAYSKVRGTFGMNGFVEAYYQFSHANVTNHPEPMGYMTPREVPISSFLADAYCVCDRWFAPLPASTQPNRLMALTGSTRVNVTHGVLPPVGGHLLLDWLTAHNVRWRVYHKALSFFLLLGRFDLAFGEHFRRFHALAHDVLEESDATFPQVILIEPSYADAPHLGSDHANDNHPPVPIGFGEQFLREIYTALTQNPARWRRTVLIATYDEHGGFYDHVPPPPVTFTPPPDAHFTQGFDSAGVRVPTIIASPLVGPRSVCKARFDHTSILQFLAEQFGAPGEPYSEDVEARRKQDVASVSAALGSEPRGDIPAAPTTPIVVPATLTVPESGKTASQQAFEMAARIAMKEHTEKARAKFPELWQVLDPRK